jgi:hypothetical protein
VSGVLYTELAVVIWRLNELQPIVATGSSCSLYKRSSYTTIHARALMHIPTAAGNLPSGAFIGVPENLLQLVRIGSYITFLQRGRELAKKNIRKSYNYNS